MTATFQVKIDDKTKWVVEIHDARVIITKNIINYVGPLTQLNYICLDFADIKHIRNIINKIEKYLLLK